MLLSNKVILVGYSGHGLVVAEACQLSQIDLVGYSEKTETTLNHFDLKYLGFEMDEDFKEWNSDKSYVLGIGDNHIRHKVGKYIQSKDRKVLNVIHPSASVTNYIEVGIGNFIARNAIINPFVKIGNFCIINTGAIVEHECVIGDAAHIAPGAVLAGNVEVGRNAFIGANAVIKQGVRIGENVIVGAGAVVIHNIENNEVVVGNPSKRIK